MNVEDTKMSHNISIDVNDMTCINNSSDCRLSLVISSRISVQFAILSRFGDDFEEIKLELAISWVFRYIELVQNFLLCNFAFQGIKNIKGIRRYVHLCAHECETFPCADEYLVQWNACVVYTYFLNRRGKEFFGQVKKG